MRGTLWLPLGLAVVAGGLVAARIAGAAEIETVPYRVEFRDGAFEVRDYPELVVAEVERQGSRDAAVGSAFRSLFDYISGKGRSGGKIAMTAPVTQSPGSIAMTAPVAQRPSGDGGWTVAFIMPAGSTIASLPPPATGDVRLATQPGQRIAAVRFSGRWTDAGFSQKAAELMQWIKARDLTPAGAPSYAYYDPPFKPWFMRRNEVLVPVARD